MNEPQNERRVLRSVELSPSQAALVYMLVMSSNIPGGRVRDAASVLTLIEAAMEPLPEPAPAPEVVDSVLAEMEANRDTTWSGQARELAAGLPQCGELDGDD